MTNYEYSQMSRYDFLTHLVELYLTQASLEAINESGSSEEDAMYLSDRCNYLCTIIPPAKNLISGKDYYNLLIEAGFTTLTASWFLSKECRDQFIATKKAYGSKDYWEVYTKWYAIYLKFFMESWQKRLGYEPLDKDFQLRYKIGYRNYRRNDENNSLK